MTRGNTPTITCALGEAVDLSLAAHVYMTFRQGSRKLTKTGDDLTIEGGDVSCALTQSETLYFVSTDSPVEVQVNWTYDDGSRGQTSIEKIDLGRTLEPEVLA